MMASEVIPGSTECAVQNLVAHSNSQSPYRPLDATMEEIRLCRIMPSDSESLLRCALSIFRLSIAPPFQCLSYVWGNATTPAYVLVNGEQVAVTQNLVVALKRMRQCGCESEIWIDAICINQADMQEKTHQVELMGRVFSHAEEVLIWLGGELALYSFNPELTTGGAPQTEIGVAEGIQLMQMLAANKHFHELPYFEECKSRRCPSAYTVSNKSWTLALRSINRLMNVAWFERTWTVQEIVLARHAWFLTGMQALDWDLIACAWRNWVTHLNSCCVECIMSLPFEDFRILQRIAKNVVDLIGARNRLRQGQHLIQPLLRLRRRESIDARDKIYGLLGLQSGQHKMCLTPDYSMSVAEVYTQFAFELIRNQGWLVPLHLDLDQKLVGLPSWVPDWTFCPDEPADYFTNRLECCTSYNAAKSLIAASAVLDGRTLIVNGIAVDRISRVSCPYRMRQTEAQQLELIAEWHEFLHLRQHGCDAYIAGGSVYDAYVETAFAGRFYQGGAFRPLKRTQFEAWQQHQRDLSRRLRVEGPGATSCLHLTMIFHHVAVLRRRMCVTAKGYVGLCPEAARPGDEVFVLCDAPAPIFLRRQLSSRPQSNEYTALGHGFLHGLMDGEAVEMDLRMQRVYLV